MEGEKPGVIESLRGVVDKKEVGKLLKGQKVVVETLDKLNGSFEAFRVNNGMEMVDFKQKLVTYTKTPNEMKGDMDYIWKTLAEIKKRIRPQPQGVGQKPQET